MDSREANSVSISRTAGYAMVPRISGGLTVKKEKDLNCLLRLQGWLALCGVALFFQNVVICALAANAYTSDAVVQYGGKTFPNLLLLSGSAGFLAAATASLVCVMLNPIIRQNFEIALLKGRLARVTVLVRNLLEQKVVDQHLRQLAATFDRVSERRNRLQVSLAGGRDARSEGEKKKLERADRDVEDARAAFWDAHALIELLGFKTLKRFRDYLSPEQQSAA